MHFVPGYFCNINNCIEEPFKSSFENTNQIMWNYFQKMIISASVKTLQINFLSTRLMFNDLIKPTKFYFSWQKKHSKRLCFISIQELLRFKKKVSWGKFVKKRRIFYKIFCSMQNFLEMQCFIDDLGEVNMGLNNNKNAFCYITFISFFLKKAYKWLKLIICNLLHENKKDLSPFYPKKYF